MSTRARERERERESEREPRKGGRIQVLDMYPTLADQQIGTDSLSGHVLDGTRQGWGGMTSGGELGRPGHQVGGAVVSKAGTGARDAFKWVRHATG